MNCNLFQVLATAAIIALVATFTANSATASDKASLSKDGALYGRLGAGILSINDIDIKASGTVQGVSYNGTGSFSFDPGPSISGALGYQINRYIAIEGELGYAQNDYDKLSGSITATYGGTNYTVSGSDKIDGSVSMFNGMGNVILSPLGADSAFNPYVGGGIGFVRVSDEIDRIGTLTVNASDSYTEFAANMIAGIDAKVSNSLSVGARYRYFWANTGTQYTEDATAHNFMLTVKGAF